MSRLRGFARAVLGTVAEVARPGVAREIDEGRHTGRNLRLKNLILEARKARARLRGDRAALESAQFGFWKGDTADFFYDSYRERFEFWFLGPHQVVVDRLVDRASRTRFDRLIEVGCGDGRVLEHVAGRLPQIPRCIGTDINPTIIERNREQYAANPRLSFAAADASTWLPGEIGDGTVLMTYGGVMEYFTPEALSAIFVRLAAQRRVAVVLVEPLDPAHDLAAETGSRVFGQENSFSHNHRHLLETAGFTVEFAEEMSLGGVRWMLVLATAGM